MKKPLKKRKARLVLHKNKNRIKVLILFLSITASYYFDDIKMIAVGVGVLYSFENWNKHV